VAQPVAQIPDSKSAKGNKPEPQPIKQQQQASNTAAQHSTAGQSKAAQQHSQPCRLSCFAYRWPQGCSTGPTAAPAAQHRAKVHLQHCSAAQVTRKGRSAGYIETGKSPAKPNGMEYIQTQFPPVLPDLPQAG